MPQRQREQMLREQVVTFKGWADELGLTRAEAAALLNMSPHTLRQWEYDRREARRFVLPLGRPAQCSSPYQRNLVIGTLDELGHAVGVPFLREAFPDMARAELQDIVKRYRRVWRKLHYQALRILHWQVPGAVWAADFAEAPNPIDGIYPYLLAVRDLASGQQLLWLPVEHPDCQTVVDAMSSLIDTFGAPLVLKTDNGSAFGAGRLRELLHQFMVLLLFSPPYWPRYNGSIEAGIGSLKTRTETHASRYGRSRSWSFDDVAFAREQANATARPQGPKGPTSNQLWQARRPLTHEQRAHFQAAVDRCRIDSHAQSECPDWPEGAPLTDRQHRALDRQAIPRALVQHGYLLYTRRRIPLPFNPQNVMKIT